MPSRRAWVGNDGRVSFVVLVRHAQSVVPTVGGPSEYERPLAQEGFVAAQQLRKVLDPLKCEKAVSSPYARAIQTIQPTTTALGIEIETWDELREWEHGFAPAPEWELLFRSAWGDPDSRFGPGESLTELTERAGATLWRALDQAAESGPIIVSGHGTWIARAFVALGRDVSVDDWLAMPMPAVYLCRSDGGRLVVKALS